MILCECFHMSFLTESHSPLEVKGRLLTAAILRMAEILLTMMAIDQLEVLESLTRVLVIDLRRNGNGMQQKLPIHQRTEG